MIKIKKNKTKFYCSSQNFTVGYIVLIFIGYSLKNTYYTQFNINIEEYLNFEEYLFIYLPVSSILLLFLHFLTIYLGGMYGTEYLFFNKNILFNKNKLSKYLKIERETNDKPKYQNYSTKKQGILFIPICLIFIVPFGFLFYSYFDNDNLLDTYFVFIMTWGIIMFVLFVVMDVLKKGNKKTLWILISSILSITSYPLYGYKLNQAKQILSGKPIMDINFTIKSDSISSNKTVLYLGETKDYLFMRNIYTNTNIIFQKKEIHKLNIKKVE